MSGSRSVQTRYAIPAGGNVASFSAPVYQVVIYPNEDNAGGYWARCPIDEKSCAFTDGNTIAETEINMFESVSLMLRDDYPDITDYSLAFIVADKPCDE